ncbi:hypothetical protein PR048_014272 [Dryococelus australis]|uniref:Uncharacterized protein n=1 Tax=Dryococelus australis TaxID=614101 RepID=A0ABQ9HDV5_9NEOP|nr:hypothetical protein PR048_014272 [Dryococelus australis]
MTLMSIIIEHQSKQHQMLFYVQRYVIDGGYSIHKLKWKKGDTYCEIAKACADFTIKNYGLATVGFDGHDSGHSIKDNTHKRRQQNMHYPIVHISGDTEFEGNQEMVMRGYKLFFYITLKLIANHSLLNWIIMSCACSYYFFTLSRDVIPHRVSMVLVRKRKFQKLLNGDCVLHSCASAFTLPGKNPADITSLGSQVMAFISGGNSTSSLVVLRYHTLTKKGVTAKSFVHPERLPPTESSAKFHCLRVYY